MKCLEKDTFYNFQVSYRWQMKVNIRQRGLFISLMGNNFKCQNFVESFNCQTRSSSLKFVSCVSSRMQGRIQDFLKGWGWGAGGLCPEVGQLGVVGIGERSEPLQLGVLGWWCKPTPLHPQIFFFFFFRFNPFRVYFEACGEFNYTSNSQKEYLKF